jgi:VCBS repeat-containing protein
LDINRLHEHIKKEGHFPQYGTCTLSFDGDYFTQLTSKLAALQAVSKPVQFQKHRFRLEKTDYDNRDFVCLDVHGSTTKAICNLLKRTKKQFTIRRLKDNGPCVLITFSEPLEEACSFQLIGDGHNGFYARAMSVCELCNEGHSIGLCTRLTETILPEAVLEAESALREILKHLQGALVDKGVVERSTQTSVERYSKAVRGL